MLKLGFHCFATLSTALFMLAITQPSSQAAAAPRASEFTLSNGMQVVVIPDHRAPVVTHMVWYRVGAADEPRGVSGIAHFLEHLMFKSTEKVAMGEFSKIVARLGGEDNAFTGQDTTSYHQRIAKDRLETVMEMEADRMVNLRLTPDEVATERNVILEERRSRIDNNPTALLDEQMNAALYLSHPYRIPVIGWPSEMAKLSREDAMRFYSHYYAPNNAILVVAGDVTPEEVKGLAEKTFGKVPANPEVKQRVRVEEPQHLAARRLVLKHPRAGNASFHRYYMVPSYSTAEPSKAEALEILAKIVADGPTSRLYKKLVVEEKVAATSGGSYSGSGLDSGTFSIYAVANEGVDLEKVESLTDAVLQGIRENGVTDAELMRAKKSLRANYIYSSDSQEQLARRYGWELVAGRSIADVEAWPEAITKVTNEDLKRAAAEFLDERRSVTGWLEPGSHEGGSGSVEKPPVPSRS